VLLLPLRARVKHIGQVLAKNGSVDLYFDVDPPGRSNRRFNDKYSGD
jgi:hypothetical protein